MKRQRGSGGDWYKLLITLCLSLTLGAFVFADVRAQEYAGGDTCVVCHDDVGEAFGKTAHGRADMSGWDGAADCEACHGPGATHVDSGGEESAMLLLAAMSAAKANAACLSCHAGNVASHWEGSVHDTMDLRCSDCHSVHSAWTNEHAIKNQNTNEACLACHNEQRKSLHQRSRHPLLEGQMSCVSCHDPHGSPTEGAISAVTINDKCYECHAEKRGPFLFEHQPVREDCAKCHEPHGSNQTMLLTTSAPRLCQSCHLFGHHQTVPGQPSQVWNQNRSCLNCHPRIHGSNHPSGVIFMR